MSTDQTKPNLIFVHLIHQALRVDGARLLATIESLEHDDPQGRSLAVRDFYDRYRAQLVAHHTHEDELFFPALAARVADGETHVDELVAQHEQLEEILQAVGERLAALADRDGDFSADRAAAVAAVSAMVEHLKMHLDLEERTAIPVLEANMPVAEYEELSSKARKATPRDEGAFQIPWLVEHASPEQRKVFFRSAPPLRIVYLLTRRRYRRVDAALLPAA